MTGAQVVPGHLVSPVSSLTPVATRGEGSIQGFAGASEGLQALKQNSKPLSWQWEERGGWFPRSSCLMNKNKLDMGRVGLAEGG